MKKRIGELRKGTIIIDCNGERDCFGQSVRVKVYDKDADEACSIESGAGCLPCTGGAAV